jgi:acyl carrier protein
MSDDYKKIRDITESIKEIISDILNEKLKPDDIDNDTPLFLNGLGLDSIDLLQLIPKIEKKFSVKISSKNYHVLKTVNYLSEYIFQTIKLRDK